MDLDVDSGGTPERGVVVEVGFKNSVEALIDMFAVVCFFTRG